MGQHLPWRPPSPGWAGQLAPRESQAQTRQPALVPPLLLAGPTGTPGKPGRLARVCFPPVNPERRASRRARPPPAPRPLAPGRPPRPPFLPRREGIPAARLSYHCCGIRGRGAAGQRRGGPRAGGRREIRRAQRPGAPRAGPFSPLGPRLAGGCGPRALGGRERRGGPGAAGPARPAGPPAAVVPRRALRAFAGLAAASAHLAAGLTPRR